MSYSKTLEYMFNQLPMYQRVGAAAYKADLKNTIEICNLLNNPQNKFKSIHVAGTNGKGSSSHMMASILQEAGYKVGLYTSPHLKDFRERIKINGKEISKQYIVDFISRHKKDFDRIQPSFFEMTVGLAFNYFAEKKVDIAVVEVGLGGRLDSTNVITPLLSIITNISYDHMNLLGDTLPKIAAEKAGIIKSGTITVVNETQKETKHVFIDKAKKENSILIFADEVYQAKKIDHASKYLETEIWLKGSKNIAYPKIESPLTGLYQTKNIIGVTTASFLLSEVYGLKITAKEVTSGIKNVIKNTGLRGRWEVLGKNPLIIADTGHNEAGIKEVLKQIKLTPHKNLHMVFGVVNDKDVTSILKLLPKKAIYYFCKASIPRALNETDLYTIAKKNKLKGAPFPTVKKALKAAIKNADKKDLIFIGGSTFVVADAL